MKAELPLGKTAAIVLNMMKPLNRFLLLLVLSCLQLSLLSSATAQKNQSNTKPSEPIDKVPPSSPEDPHATYLKLLGEELAKESIVWLDAKGEKFIGLWEPDSSGNSFGSIVILHGEGQTADWPDTINPLRTSLIQFGWSTLSIELPDPDGNKSTEELAAERIQSAVKYLDKKGQYNLVMFGIGKGATRGMEFIKNLPSNSSAENFGASTPTIGPFRALIMVSARAVEISRDFRLPTLDLYYDEHYLDDTEVQDRLTLAKKYRLPYYHQIRMLKPEISEYGEENRLTRRVRGFLNKYAKGVEVHRN